MYKLNKLANCCCILPCMVSLYFCSQHSPYSILFVPMHSNSIIVIVFLQNARLRFNVRFFRLHWNPKESWLYYENNVL